MSGYLLIIGDRQALGWILNTRLMAFGDPLRREARGLKVGDHLVLYTTRGCFKNPSRDRGRIFGEALVDSELERGQEPLQIGDRTFPYTCALRLTAIAPYGLGPELAPHAAALNALRPAGAGWATRLRRSLMPLDDHDVEYVRSLPGYPVEQPSALLEAPYTRWAPGGTG